MATVCRVMMRNSLYFRLAATNLRKNRRVYLPYLLTCIGMVAMYYIIYALALNQSLHSVHGGEQVSLLLSYGMWIMAVFSVIFLFYTHSFLIKRRKKEFGLYNILGMGKRHIAKMTAVETVYTSLISLALGLVAGVVLSKLFYLLLLNIVQYGATNSQLMLQFEFSTTAFYRTLLLFCGIFLLNYLNTIRMIHLSKPVELLKGGQVGEKEPKTKWLLAILGVICLGAGYYFAVTVESPLDALTLFIFAVLLVVIGTYCLFTAGSIAVLKLLRKNKRYYYQTRHFTSISGLLYRMKQNAVGLANICILSTAVLVLLSATVSLYMGGEDILRNRFPRNITVQLHGISEKDAPQIEQMLHAFVQRQQVSSGNTLHYSYLSFAAQQNGNVLQGELDAQVYYGAGMRSVYCIPLADYNAMRDTKQTLQPDEVLLYEIGSSIEGDTIVFGDRTYRIRERIEDMDLRSSSMDEVVGAYYLIVPDLQTIWEIYQAVGGEPDPLLSYFYGFDVDADADVQIRMMQGLQTLQAQQEWHGGVECAEEARDSMTALYGGMFFIGIFLGLLFILATVLIIYYKQVSEGYEDQSRFEIMQQVGMSLHEVKQSIHSQIMTVFFLPLLMACVHLAFAYPILNKCMAMINMTNSVLFIWCCVGVALLFALFYVLIYSLTARTYYKIVRQ